jgi:hypothetical protein
MFHLQNCMDKLQNESGPFTGTCVMSSDDGNQFVGVKVEDVTDIKVEEDPWPATSTGIKTEPAVSCLCVRTHTHVHTHACVNFHAHGTNNVQTLCTIRC